MNSSVASPEMYQDHEGVPTRCPAKRYVDNKNKDPWPSDTQIAFRFENNKS